MTFRLLLWSPGWGRSALRSSTQPGTENFITTLWSSHCRLSVLSRATEQSHQKEVRAAAYDIFGNEGDMWFKVSHREVRSHQRPPPNICSRARSAADRYEDMHFADTPRSAFTTHRAFTVPLLYQSPSLQNTPIHSSCRLLIQIKLVPWEEPILLSLG